MVNGYRRVGIAIMCAGAIATLVGCTNKDDHSGAHPAQTTTAVSSIAAQPSTTAQSTTVRATTAPSTSTKADTTSAAPASGLSSLTCGQLSAMSVTEQQKIVEELARLLNKPLIYSNPNGFKIVVAMCSKAEELVKDSFGFA